MSEEGEKFHLKWKCIPCCYMITVLALFSRKGQLQYMKKSVFFFHKIALVSMGLTSIFPRVIDPNGFYSERFFIPKINILNSHCSEQSYSGRFLF